MSINLKALFITSAFIASASALMLTGCAHDTNLKQLTSLSVDCKTKEVHISNDSVALNGEETWTAKCNGKIYSCDYLSESDLSCYEIDK